MSHAQQPVNCTKTKYFEFYGTTMLHHQLQEMPFATRNHTDGAHPSHTYTLAIIIQGLRHCCKLWQICNQTKKVNQESQKIVSRPSRNTARCFPLCCHYLDVNTTRTALQTSPPSVTNCAKKSVGRELHITSNEQSSLGPSNA